MSVSELGFEGHQASPCIEQEYYLICNKRPEVEKGEDPSLSLLPLFVWAAVSPLADPSSQLRQGPI